jgi:hypothetical protein
MHMLILVLGFDPALGWYYQRPRLVLHAPGYCINKGNKIPIGKMEKPTNARTRLSKRTRPSRGIFADIERAGKREQEGDGGAGAQDKLPPSRRSATSAGAERERKAQVRGGYIRPRGSNTSRT